MFSNETRFVLSKSLASLIIKIFGVIFTMSISILLGRTIGPDGIGILSVSNQFSITIIIFCLLGVNLVIVKKLSIYNEENNLKAIGQTMNTVYFFNGALSIILTSLLLFLIPWITNTVLNKPELQFPMMILVLVTPFQIFSRLFGSALLGLSKVWQSSLAENVLSSFFSLFILLIIYTLNEMLINAKNVAIIYAFSRLLTMVAVGFYWRSIFNYKSGKGFVTKVIFKTSVPFFVISISSFLMFKADSLILAAFIDVRSIGLFTVAASISLFFDFLLQIVSQAISPRFAVLYKENKTNELQILLTQVCKILLFFGGALFLIILFFGSSILSLWGSEFKEAYYILLILSISQLHNICLGPVGSLLMMSGFEKKLMQYNIYITIFSVLLGMLTASTYGVLAYTIGLAVVRVTLNTVKINLLRKHLNLKVF